MPRTTLRHPAAPTKATLLAVVLAHIWAGSACVTQDPPEDDASDPETSAADASDDQVEPKDCTAAYAVGPTPTSVDALDPTVCLQGAPPTADQKVAELPMPDPTCCEAQTPIFFKAGDTVPSPSLTVELGTSHTKTGAFVPYVPGQWLRIAHGGQGGIHVDAAFRVALAGEQATKVKLQVFATGHFLRRGRDRKLPHRLGQTGRGIARRLHQCQSAEAGSGGTIPCHWGLLVSLLRHLARFEAGPAGPRYGHMGTHIYHGAPI